MATITQSISEMATSVHVKDVLSFSLNAEYLHHNFDILRQCLMKLQEMEGSQGSDRSLLNSIEARLSKVESGLAGSQSDHLANCQKIKDLQNNIGDDFMSKMYGIVQKTKNMFSFEDTVLKLQSLGKFVTVKSFNEWDEKLHHEIDEVKKIKGEFERYVPNSVFSEFKERQAVLQTLQEKKNEGFQGEVKRLDGQILKLSQRLEETQKQLDENGVMIKEINFPEMMDKNKRFKEEMDQKMNDLLVKMKKKVGTHQLSTLEQTMIEKLDKFLSDNQKSKAQKEQTKNALVFLEKRITELEEYLADKASEDDKDGLFTTKKVHCASCTKDLGKFQGRLGQFKPWSIFPCKEMDPQKTGGFGYMSYLDKVQIKKGSVQDDQAFQRLNKTAVDKDRELSPKRGSSTARGSNIISNYGSQQKGGISLKDMYFRQLKTQKGDRASKVFRVKKQSMRQVSDLQRVSEV